MAVFYGTNGADTLLGTPYDDDIYGFGGNDWLFGGGGHDTLIGGTGINDFWGGSGHDRFVMSTRSSAGFSDDLIQDFTFDIDRIDVSRWGVSDFSQIRTLLYVDAAGDAALNAFYDGYDHVLRIGDVHPSQLIASDFIYSNSGSKNETGTAFDDVLFGSRFDDTLKGIAGDDVLLGGRGGDSLSGGAGWDLLNGGSGDDTLDGGSGNDRLRGGPGADTFLFDLAVLNNGTKEIDRILDYHRSQSDVIDLPDGAGSIASEAFVGGVWQLTLDGDGDVVKLLGVFDTDHDGHIIDELLIA